MIDEIGIDTTSQESTHVDDISLADVSLIITLCGSVTHECPTVVGKETWCWGKEDPASAQGSDLENIQVFREINDAIRCRIHELALELVS